MNTKTFYSHSGLEILAGQDDQSNDYLSIKYAHPADLWFHIAGFPGSHVLLRCGGENIEADKKSIEQAAAVAVWFSKMRKGKNVSVHYCPAKNVSKPSGSKPGTVNIRQFKKITVNPSLPENGPK